MRVPELKELATKAGVAVPAKSTKDKIIALLLESPSVAPLLGSGAESAPAAPAPTIGATPSSAAEPAHVAKPLDTKDAAPAASNAVCIIAVYFNVLSNVGS
jgi:hypothetical protein